MFSNLNISREGNVSGYDLAVNQDRFDSFHHQNDNSQDVASRNLKSNLDNSRGDNPSTVGSNPQFKLNFMKLDRKAAPTKF